MLIKDIYMFTCDSCDWNEEVDCSRNFAFDYANHHSLTVHDRFGIVSMRGMEVTVLKQ
jgi:hypothetical protein